LRVPRPAPLAIPLGAEMQLVLEFPHLFFRRSRSAFPRDNRLRASVHFKRGTTRGASLHGHCPASSLLSPPPTPALAPAAFGCVLMRLGCGPPPHQGRSPELRSHSVPTCRPADPAAVPCRLRLLYGLGCQPLSSVKRLGLRIEVSRGSHGFTVVTARRFATVPSSRTDGLTQ